MKISSSSGGEWNPATSSYHWELFRVDTLGANERRRTSNPWSSQVPSRFSDGGRSDVRVVGKVGSGLTRLTRGLEGIR